MLAAWSSVEHFITERICSFLTGPFPYIIIVWLWAVCVIMIVDLRSSGLVRSLQGLANNATC